MRTLGPGQLPILGTLAEALRLYRRHWKLLIPLGAIVLLPQAIIDTSFSEIEIDRLESLGDYLKLLGIPFTVVLSLAGEALLAGAITALVLQWRLGHRLPGLLAFLGSLAWFRLIAADLLIAVGAAIGVVLLIVPGLLFLAYFSITPAVIEIEDRGIRDAFRRSARLVRGRVWPGDGPRRRGVLDNRGPRPGRCWRCSTASSRSSSPRSRSTRCSNRCRAW